MSCVRRPRRHLFRSLALLLLPCLLSCGEDRGAGPVGPTDALLSITGATEDDGAVVLEVGPGATGIAAEGEGTEAHAASVRDGFVVVVFGPLDQGPVLRLGLVDPSTVPAVRIREVAAEDGTLRPSLEGYSARVKPVR